MRESFLIEIPNPEDIDAIVRLETECSLTSRGATRYTADLDNQHEILLVTRLTDCETDQGSVVGIFSARLVLDELQIDNIAVASGNRMTGIASKLLEKGLGLASKHGAIKAFLEVRASNSPALGLYKKAGFEQIGIRKSYYRNPDEDALVLSLNLVEKMD